QSLDFQGAAVFRSRVLRSGEGGLYGCWHGLSNPFWKFFDIALFRHSGQQSSAWDCYGKAYHFPRLRR
ncbi:hypothetical protein, partial [Iodidimonas nitroreducens]|uniref:hypothetical protein n=1 Tax=Iodidimonas nitroreducens TaxID=1236968 RepID=UPI0028D417C7